MRWVGAELLQRDLDQVGQVLGTVWGDSWCGEQYSLILAWRRAALFTKSSDLASHCSSVAFLMFGEEASQRAGLGPAGMINLGLSQHFS